VAVAVHHTQWHIRVRWDSPWTRDRPVAINRTHDTHSVGFPCTRDRPVAIHHTQWHTFCGIPLDEGSACRNSSHSMTHTHSVGFSWTRDWPVAIHLTKWHTHIRWDSPGRGIGLSQRSVPAQHNIRTQQTSTPPAGFEPAVPASERPQTFAFDRLATGIRIFRNLRLEYKRVRGVLNRVLLPYHTQIKFPVCFEKPLKCFISYVLPYFFGV
jgi:hypothetical protein